MKNINKYYMNYYCLNMVKKKGKHRVDASKVFNYLFEGFFRILLCKYVPIVNNIMLWRKKRFIQQNNKTYSPFY